MADVLDRAATALLAEHLADSIGAASDKNGIGWLAMTRVSRPLLVAALRHYVKCLHMEVPTGPTGADGREG